MRKDQPINLCGAFGKPVSSKNGYVEQSVKNMKEYAERVYRDYAEEPVCALGIGEALSSMAEVMPLNQLLDRLKVEMERQLVDGGEK